MIFVLGTGRSGTSVVARVLQVRFGVDMGDDLPAPSESVNPGGDVEDRDIREATIRAVRTGSRAPWRARLRLHARGRPEPWGLKEPRFAYVCTDLLECFPGADLVWCDRDVEAAARSAAGVCAGGYSHHLREMIRRYELLERGLRGRDVVRLDMNGRWPEEQIAERLGDLPTLQKFAGPSRGNASRVPREGATSVVSGRGDRGSVSGSAV